MTRQWLADPDLMCRQHLLGEHLEAHIFLAKMEKNYHLDGFISGSMFFGGAFLAIRHDLLASRIIGHKTPLFVPDSLVEKYPDVSRTENHIRKSLRDLLGRCERCFRLHAVTTAVGTR